jgi:hypothetical protein
VILIAYDGSADAQAGIDRAGELKKGEPATILTVWERLIDVLARTGSGMALGDVDFADSISPLRIRRVSGPRRVPSAHSARP